MKKWKIPLYSFVIGGVFKSVLMIMWKLYQPIEVKLLLFLDPLGTWVAEVITMICFDQRRFAPTPGEALFFEIMAILAFAIECALLGLIVQMAIRKFFQRTRTGTDYRTE